MDNPNLESTLGQILWGINNRNKHRKTRHYMVYLGPVENQPELFLGVMLTREDGYNNILLPEDCFEKQDMDGTAYPFPTATTYFRPRQHLKKVEWRPFSIAGQLTARGLKLVNDSTSGDAASFYEYNL